MHYYGKNSVINFCFTYVDTLVPFGNESFVKHPE